MIPSLVVLAALAAQAPPSKQADAEDLTRRMLAFDKDGDGRLTVAEVTDPRLHRLLGRADADGDGFATRDELAALAEREHSGARGFGDGPPPGPGGPPGGPRPPRPGQVLPATLRRELDLTPEQSTQLDALQAKVDAALAEILTDDQRRRLREIGPPGGGPGPRRPAPPAGGPR